MKKIFFNTKSHLTIGIEIEVQLLHKKTLDLEPKAIEILNRLNNHKIHPEIFQSMVEITSDICTNVHEIKTDIKNTFLAFDEVCSSLDLRYATTGTHPFAKYNERKIFPLERYHLSINRNQWISRRLCIFGLHVHLGMKTKEDCIDFMNMFQWFLPYFTALSASSPFWQAENTGLHSSRLTAFEASPTSGHCPHLNNWEEFAQQITLLTNCGSINSMKDIWWDIRPSIHGTLEIRICDGIATSHELSGIVALIHTIAHFYDRYKNYFCDNNHLFNFGATCPLWLIREHKWRALRYGIDMNIITTKGINIPFKQATEGLLEILRPIINELGYNEYITYIEQILLHGTSSNRQYDLHMKCKSFKKVAELNANECKESFINNKNFIKTNKEPIEGGLNMHL